MERTAERTAKKQGEMDAFHGRKEETPDASNAEGSSVSKDGAGGGTRTHTVSLPTDFESVTSTNSITPALTLHIISDTGRKFKYILPTPCKNTAVLQEQRRFPLVKGRKME